jgi:hypothetical protein
MNYLKLINQFWQLRRSKRITNLQADLYYFLMQECNSRNWENPFQCSNGLVCTSIGITEKSLIDARNVLQQIGLIEFEKGITKQKAPTYYLLDYCNKVSIPGGIPVSNGVGIAVGNQGNTISKQNETNLFVVVKGEEKDVDYLKNLFENDEGLRRRWLDNGYKHGDFPSGLDYFFQRNHGKTYEEFKKLRDHLFNWIPKYSFELNDKKNAVNGKQHSNHSPGKHGDKGIGRSMEFDKA